MKKLLLVLSLVAITGAGCAKAPATQQPTDTTTPPATETTQPAAAAPATTEDVSGTATIKTSTGGEIAYKTAPVKTAPTSEGDVPVTDIYLGEPQVKVDMEAGNMFFKPTVINAKAGNAVQVTFTKVDGSHTFVIDGTNANFQITQGETKIFTAPSKPGSYPFYCDIGNHRAMGMMGTLIVK